MSIFMIRLRRSCISVADAGTGRLALSRRVDQAKGSLIPRPAHTRCVSAVGASQKLDRVAWCRQIGPRHALIVKTLLEDRLDDFEIRRDVEIARRLERRMADLQNPPSRRLVFELRKFRYNRPAAGPQTLRDSA